MVREVEVAMPERAYLTGSFWLACNQYVVTVMITGINLTNCIGRAEWQAVVSQGVSHGMFYN